MHLNFNFSSFQVKKIDLSFDIKLLGDNQGKHNYKNEHSHIHNQLN